MLLLDDIRLVSDATRGKRLWAYLGPGWKPVNVVLEHFREYQTPWELQVVTQMADGESYEVELHGDWKPYVPPRKPAWYPTHFFMPDKYQEPPGRRIVESMLCELEIEFRTENEPIWLMK